MTQICVSVEPSSYLSFVMLVEEYERYEGLHGRPSPCGAPYLRIGSAHADWPADVGEADELSNGEVHFLSSNISTSRTVIP